MGNRSTLLPHDLEIHCLLTPYQFRCTPWASLTPSFISLYFEMPTMSNCILRNNLKTPINPVFASGNKILLSLNYREADWNQKGLNTYF